MKQTIDILIGDDEFKDLTTKSIFKNLHENKLKESLPSFTINWKYVTEPEKIIEEAKIKNYDVIVTDLDYDGDGSGKQGYEIVDTISQMQHKPLLILCTSSNNYQEIKARTQGKIDYHAGTGQGHKFNDLVNILIKHYQK